MEPLSLLNFALAAALLVVTPGPNTFLILKTVPTAGRTSGFMNIGGFVTAFFLHGSLAILGISIILVQASELFAVIKVLGAIYLAWIGLKALRDAWRGLTPTFGDVNEVGTHHKQEDFQNGFLTNALNPKVSLFYLAIFPQFIPPDASVSYYGVVLVAIHIAINVLWFSLLILLLNKLRTFLQRRSLQRTINAVTGAIFLGFSVRLATYRP
ncbi:MAG: LysE family translocator [Chloroflexota bacterium]